uniref:NADH-ubiquinone oxidoreductase chain 5 n=1 Tax=Asymmetron sp. A TK-2007 TaxID=426588 RepID=A7X7E9_9BRAN|nr:NADH dehydrogenase subunit 5 [Asymmetron sp. A TK-2007]BAF76619.1 NADH dehydrogenase subunit 5 [Asymmetron sp. A TK-2007]
MLQMCGGMSMLCLLLLAVALFNRRKEAIAEAIKLGAYVNVALLSVFLFTDESELVMVKWEWLNLGGYSLTFSYRYDVYTCCFFAVGMYVTWNILVFSLYYMSSDPGAKLFCKYLGMFLIAMLVLVSAETLFQLLVGWEGVGVMSYLLISWWYARSDANTAALQAIFYNRIGDMGLIGMLLWCFVNNQEWTFSSVYVMSNVSLIFLFGGVLAAMGKSAQLGLHPWLPAAMEGPTPVSSLLHSSTMVVAGVFLLIRLSPLILTSGLVQMSVFVLGSLTTLFSALCALTQNDMKKVVAYSTASQLGLMVTAVGVGMPQLAFLHICMHAFFKAMLFMCSGGYIHGLQNEQDVRKMGGLSGATPVTSVCLFVGSAALVGTPFLAGFFSKDPIIEAINMSNANSWGVGLLLVATSFTAVYSFRLFYYGAMGHPRVTPFQPLNESYKFLVNPLQRLGYASILGGVVFVAVLTPKYNIVLSLPVSLKLMAVAVTLLGALLAWDVMKLLHKEDSADLGYTSFISQVGYYPSIMHKVFPWLWLHMGEKLQLQGLDRGWTELGLPQGVGANSGLLSNYVVQTQTSLVKMYLASMLLAFFAAMIMISF